MPDRSSDAESHTVGNTAKSIVEKVQNNCLEEAKDDISLFEGTHDASSGVSLSMEVFGMMTPEQRAQMSNTLFKQGSDNFTLLDENKDGGFSDSELKTLLRDGKGTSLERTAAAYMLINSDRLSGGTGNITPESLNREATPFTLPPLALVDMKERPGQAAGDPEGSATGAPNQPTSPDLDLSPAAPPELSFPGADITDLLLPITPKEPAPQELDIPPLEPTDKPLPGADVTDLLLPIDPKEPAPLELDIASLGNFPSLSDTNPLVSDPVELDFSPPALPAELHPGETAVGPTLASIESGNFLDFLKETEPPNKSEASSENKSLRFEEITLGTGGKLGSNEAGDLQVTRPDGATVLQTSIGGKAIIVEKTGSDTITWTTKEGDTTGKTWVSDPPGKERQNMVLEKNGNLTYTNNGEKHIIRSNGAELIEGPGRATFNFDESGRISWIKYPDGENSFGFKYKGQSEEIETVYCHTRQSNKTSEFKPDHKWGKPSITADGIYSQETYQTLGGRIFKGKHTYGTDGNDEIHKLMTDGSVIVKDGYGKNIRTRIATNDDWVNGPDAEKPKTDKSLQPTDFVGIKPNESLVESTDTSFKLKGYMLPSPDQLGAGSCLYMAATGIAEFLLNKANGIAHPSIGGPTDLSEQWTIGLSSQIPLQNNYTDAVELLRSGGTVQDQNLKFRAYGDSSWMREGLARVDASAISHNLPDMRKEVLFSAGGEGTQLTNGIMTGEHLKSIKDFLRNNESPVLFIYKPPGTNWWHANIITGFDDQKQTFTMRDSSFGNKVESEQPYNYDGRSPWGPQKYRGEFEMSYQDALRWGNHATGYALASEGSKFIAHDPANGAIR